MNRIIISLICFSVVLLMANDMNGQRRSTKRSSDRSSSRTERSSSRTQTEDTETISIKDRLAYNIHIGDIGFGNGFQFSAKADVGYKLSERFTVGLGGKTFYFFQNVPNAPDNSLFTYAGYIYPRFKITESFYVKGEYNLYSIDFGPNADRINEAIPMIGGGYTSGFGPWKFGIELLFLPVPEDRDALYNNVFEYTFSFMYNF